MKTKIVSLLMIAGLISSISFISCKKKVATPSAASLDGQVQQHNTDANNVKAESDQADNDINNSLSNTSLGGRFAGVNSSPLCGVTIDTSQIANKIVIFNFDGVTPCFSPTRIRSGQIKVQLTTGNYWHLSGSVITETFTNFKVKIISTGKSVQFNGTKTLKNINGNDWLGFFTSTSTLKYQERAIGVNVVFEDGSHAIWNSARTTQWNYLQANNNPLNIPYAYIAFTANGDTTINSHANTDSWGTNRYGFDFNTYYTSPWVSNTYCGLWSPTSGQLIHHVNNHDYTITAGVDPQGNPSSTNCSYGFKVSWENGNGTQTVVLSY